jgi:cytochrome c oxidase subunit 2
MRIGKFFAALGAGSLSAVASGAAWAQENFQGLETIGKPVPRGINLQPPVTEVAERLQWLDNFVLIISEVIWTVVPILILIVIGSFSLPILFHQMEVPKADVTIKITGNQWYWTYEYTDNEFEFDSFMLGHPGTIEGDMAFVLNDETKALLKEYGYAEDEFLLATDTAVVVPVNQNIVLQITGADVIHSWAIPSFGVKLDAVPGRLAETWFNATKEGVYFGQCSELCGKDHAYMPITVKVVSQEVYDTWLAGAIDEYAGTPVPVALASN